MSYPVKAGLLSMRHRINVTGFPPKESDIRSLRKRCEFIAIRTGRRQHSALFVLQARQRRDNQCSHEAIRIGYTVTRKVGNAVKRNRIKRRMKEAVRIVLPSVGRAAHDYVLIGKRAALNAGFETLVAELKAALRRIHQNQ